MEILIILLLILLNGVFSMSEIALVSSRRFKLESAAKRGDAGAKRAMELADKPNTFLSTVQIGITLIGILTGIFSGETLTDNLKSQILQIDFLAPYAESLAVALIVIFITYLSLVFGELIPKRIGLSFPETISATVAGPMSLISKIAKPFIWILSKTNDFFLRILGIKESGEGVITEEEIKSIIAQSTNSGEIQEIEQDIVKRVFSLGDRKAGEIMTHRSKIVYLDIKHDLETVKDKINNDPHTFYPLVENNLDHLKGIVSIKDLFPKAFADQPFSLTDYAKKALFVHEHNPVYRVLEQFKSSGVHIAVVVDEYGALQGIVTLNDIFDSLVGDIIEDSTGELQIIQRDNRSWLADGQLPYFELVDYFNITEVDEPEGFNTLAGLILQILNHIPVEGEKIEWKGYELEIVDMDERRIDKVLIRRL